MRPLKVLIFSQRLLYWYAAVVFVQAPMLQSKKSRKKSRLAKVMNTHLEGTGMLKDFTEDDPSQQ